LAGKRQTTDSLGQKESPFFLARSRPTGKCPIGTTAQQLLARPTPCTPGRASKRKRLADWRGPGLMMKSSPQDQTGSHQSSGRSQRLFAPTGPEQLLRRPGFQGAITSISAKEQRPPLILLSEAAHRQKKASWETTPTQTCRPAGRGGKAGSSSIQSHPQRQKNTSFFHGTGGEGKKTLILATTSALKGLPQKYPAAKKLIEGRTAPFRQQKEKKKEKTQGAWVCRPAGPCEKPAHGVARREKMLMELGYGRVAE